MTKAEFISLIKKRLPETSEVHSKTVELSISTLFSDIIFSKFKRGEIDQFAKPYPDIEVKTDAKGKFYCDLPVKIIASPSGFGSVRRIYPSEEEGILFLMIHPVKVRLIKHDEVYKVLGAIPYYLKGGNKVMFPVKNMKGISQVDMNIIPLFSEYEMDEEVVMPGGSEWTIVKEIAALFAGTPPKDKVND